MYNPFHGLLYAVGYSDVPNQTGANLFALFFSSGDAQRFLSALSEPETNVMAIYRVTADRNGAFTSVEKI